MLNREKSLIYGDLACILYTSGTTGVPKGVKITREGVTSYVDFYVNEYDLNSNSTYALYSSIGFDVSAIRGMCSPIYAGSCLDIIPKDIRLNMRKLNKYILLFSISLMLLLSLSSVSAEDDSSVSLLNEGSEGSNLELCDDGVISSSVDGAGDFDSFDSGVGEDLISMISL